MTTPATTPDLSNTLVLSRVEDNRLVMRQARLWARMVEAGHINDPVCPALRMLSVSAFVVAGTARAPEHHRARPAFGVRQQEG